MVIIRKSSKKEAKNITRIKTLCYETDSINFNVDWTGPTGYNNIDTTIKQINNNLCYSFYDDEDDRLIGFIELIELDYNRYLLNTVVLDPKYDNKGYTKQALKLLEKIMFNVKIWEVDVPKHAVKNQSFYRRLGYKKQYEFMYANTLPAIRYAKSM